MSPDRWSDTERLFQAAAALSPPDRTRYLATACADATLRAEVEALLAVHDRTGVMDGPLGLTDVLAAGPDLELPDGVVLTLDGLEPGARVGPYRIERELGRGGMGRVYLAERADGGFAQTVALKLVRPDAALAGEVVRERFLRERAVLAGLEHPAIARLLDGGQTPAGEPYFALEPVDGVPITDAADREHLSVEARVRLFLQVCDAVAYAHRRLVAHRDIKPSNVLVARAPDGRLQAKLLDFGVAGLLDSATDGETTGAERPFTPDYAAPEQVRGETAGTSADVWALGVLLHRLLAGRRPFRFGDRHRAALLATMAAGAEPPSRAATRPPRDGEGPPEAVADARATTPERLGARLRGDLDAIVARCLRPEPEARYASVDALADDLRRHLDGRPVMARRGGQRYRTGRFVRRHRTGVAATVAVVALALALAVTSAVQARATRRALAQARAEADNTAAVSDFLTSLMGAQNPRSETGPETPIGDVLRDGAARAERELAGQPLVLARLLDAVGTANVDLGAYGAADTVLTRALALRRRHAGRGSLDEAAALASLGWLATVRGETDRADSLLTAALVTQRRAAPGSPELAATLTTFGTARADAGDTRGALAALAEAVAILRPRGPSVALANALNDTGVALVNAGRFEASLGPSREALAIRRRLLGADHADIAISLSNVGLALADAGRPADADGPLGEAVRVARRTFGPENPSTLATELNWTRSLRELGRADDAARLAEHALGARRRVLPAGHPAIGVALKIAADVDTTRGLDARAEARYREALALFGTDETNGGAAGTLLALGTLLLRQGRAAEALDVLMRADRFLGELLPAGHPRRRAAAQALAEARAQNAGRR